MLAGALLPLIDPDQDKALKLVRDTLDTFPVLYEAKWLNMMCAKL